MLPDVIININTQGVGGVASDNYGIVGICLTGVAVADKLVLDTAYSVTGIDAAKAIGIDETNNAAAYRHVKEFYEEGGEGKKLWLIVSDVATTLSEKIDLSEDVCPAKILVDAAGGEIKILGVTWDPGASYTAIIANGLEADVIAALPLAQAFSLNYVAKVMPLFVVLDGLYYTGDPADLTSNRTRTLPRVQINLFSRRDDGTSSVGTVLGRYAKIPVMRSIGRKKDGALLITDAYLSNGEKIETQLDGLGDLHDKGYIVGRKFPRSAGYYFNDDPTCVAVSNDLCQGSRVRTIDKTLIITYDTYVEEINDEISINKDGTMDAVILKNLQVSIEKNIGLQMDGEISTKRCIINPLQNVLSTNKVAIKVGVTPKGSLKEIIVELGFENPTLTVS